MSPDNDLQFATLPGLWERYDQEPRQLGYRARSLDEAIHWQAELRPALAKLLGGVERTSGDFDDQVIIEEDQSDHLRQEIVLQVAPGEYMPCYVLTPHTPPPYRTMIALHGHGTWGARPLVGAAREPGERHFVAELNYDYGLQLVRRGYQVFVPELRGFGQRMEPSPWREVHDLADPDAWVSSCRFLAVNALLMGETLLGWRVRDVMRLVDYVLARPDASPDHLGCAGLSGGGTITLFTAALDERINCAVVSGYFNTFRDSIMAINHCLCNFVPGMARQAEMSDIAGLIAPRPLFTESGIHDPIYPIAGARTALARLQQIYRQFEAGERLQADFFEGGHQWHGVGVFDWLEKWL
ncbi:MAG: hypothetical protein J5I90_07165 [Caldilineales bacterium]|nr:hypothetical protein [Caldilineales bacterium]